VGEEHLAASYVEWVRNLELNLACVGYRWILDEPVLDSPMNVYLTYNSVSTQEDSLKMELGVFPDHSYVYLGTTSLYPGLAPVGKQLVYACMSCLGDPAIGIEPYLDHVRAMVAKIEPELFEHIEREETFGPATVPVLGRDSVLPGQGGESYGVALSVGQYGDRRLNGESPIGGLFYVGCDAGGFGLGTHQALDSAVNVSRLVLAYHQALGQG
jgi:phytoene dehydrogenase-like protein